MNTTEYDYSPYHSRRSLIIRAVIGLVLLGGGAYFSYNYFFNNTLVLTPENSYHSAVLSEEQAALLQNIDISDYLQMNLVSVKDEAVFGIKILNYHPSDESFSFAVDDDQHMQLVPTASSTGAIIEINPDNGETYATTYDFSRNKYAYLPLQEDQLSYSVYPLPGKDWYAMDTFRSDALNTPEIDDIANWNVRIYDRENDVSLRFPEAVSPQWFNDGQDVIYLKKDGIYRHHIDDDTSIKIFGGYTNLSSRARLAVSDRSDYLLLTLPSANSFVLLHFDDSENNVVREVARQTASDAQFISPVFSPNGTQFALISRSTTNTPANILLIYSVLSPDPIYNKDMSELLPGQLSLSSWNSFETIAPQKQSVAAE